MNKRVYGNKHYTSSVFFLIDLLYNKSFNFLNTKTKSDINQFYFINVVINNFKLIAMNKIITIVFAIYFTKHDASSCNVELLCPYTFFVNQESKL